MKELDGLPGPRPDDLYGAEIERLPLTLVKRADHPFTALLTREDQWGVHYPKVRVLLSDGTERMRPSRERRRAPAPNPEKPQ